jgi:hypothetical protein
LKKIFSHSKKFKIKSRAVLSPAFDFSQIIYFFRWLYFKLSPTAAFCAAAFAGTDSATARLAGFAAASGSTRLVAVPSGFVSAAFFGARRFFCFRHFFIPLNREFNGNVFSFQHQI